MFKTLRNIASHSYCISTLVSACFQGDSLGANTYWAAGLHLYTPLPFRPARGGLGDRFKTHFFLNGGNLLSLDGSMTLLQNKLVQLFLFVHLQVNRTIWGLNWEERSLNLKKTNTLHSKLSAFGFFLSRNVVISRRRFAENWKGMCENSNPPTECLFQT